MRNRSAKKYVVGAALFMFAAFACLCGALWYLYQQTQTLGDVSARLDELQKEEASVIGLRALLKETSQTREEFDTFVVRRSAVVPYIEELERVAKLAGLVVDVRTFTTTGDPISEGDRVGEVLRLELEVRGPFDSLMEAIYRIETLPVVAFLHTLRLEYVDETEWAAYMRIDAPGYIHDEQ